jgi:hypothetical protein
MIDWILDPGQLFEKANFGAEKGQGRNIAHYLSCSKVFTILVAQMFLQFPNYNQLQWVNASIGPLK